MVRQSSPGNSRLTAALHEGALGLLSTASFGRVVTEATRQAQHTEFVAVANRDAARARAFADELGLPGSFGSYEQLPATSSWTRRQHRARWPDLGARHSRVASLLVRMAVPTFIVGVLSALRPAGRCISR
jgi:hypothetical protein